MFDALNLSPSPQPPSPRVGNRAFVAHFRREMDGRSVRVTNAHDVVPTLPPAAFGFLHVPRETWHYVVGGADKKYDGGLG